MGTPFLTLIFLRMKKRIVVIIKKVIRNGSQILVVVSTMHRCFPVLQNLLLHENPFVKRFCHTRKSMYGLRAIFANNLFQLKSFSPPKFDGKLFDLKLKNEEMFQALWRKPEANAESVADVYRT